MKKLLILIEKQSQTHLILQLLNENKEFFDSYKKIELTATIGFTLYKFKYPNKLKYKDYPLTKTYETEYTSWKYSELEEPRYHSFAKVFKQENQYIIEGPTFQFTQPEIHDFNDILIVVDNDASGVFSAKQFLKNINQENKNIFFFPCNGLEYRKEDERIDKFQKTINKSTLKEFEELSKSADIKYYFDYNYNLNSIVFTGEILKDLKPESELKYMSKYTVLLYLYLLENKRKYTYFQIRDICSNYKGTGKYSSSENFLTTIGSPVSFGLIIQNLIELGLLEEKEKFLEIKETNYFVKRMYDPDLPFRIANWMESTEEIEIIFKKIDMYLLTMFDAQKKKNNKMLKK